MFSYILMIIFILFIIMSFITLLVGIVEKEMSIVFMAAILFVFLIFAAQVYGSYNFSNQENTQLAINEEQTDTESTVDNAISDAGEKENMLPSWEIGYYVFLSLMSILFIVLFCLPGSQDTSEEINTNEDNTKTAPRGIRKNRENLAKIDDIDFCELAEKNQKLSYIVWAVEYLNNNGRQNYTRKLSNYYIPEIISAYKQYRKVKSLNEKEMTAEAKQHYEKIVNLSYRIAKTEINKAAEEIVTDMDCNAEVCESIYKKDGYSSMSDEISDASVKREEKVLHAKSINKDTLLIWDSDHIVDSNSN